MTIKRVISDNTVVNTLSKFHLFTYKKCEISETNWFVVDSDFEIFEEPYEKFKEDYEEEVVEIVEQYHKEKDMVAFEHGSYSVVFHPIGKIGTIHGKLSLKDAMKELQKVVQEAVEKELIDEEMELVPHFEHGEVVFYNEIQYV